MQRKARIKKPAAWGGGRKRKKCGGRRVSKNIGADRRQRNVDARIERSDQDREEPGQPVAAVPRGQRIRVGLFVRGWIVRDQLDRLAARGRKKYSSASGDIGTATGRPGSGGAARIHRWSGGRPDRRTSQRVVGGVDRHGNAWTPWAAAARPGA